MYELVGAGGTQTNTEMTDKNTGKDRDVEKMTERDKG